MSPYELPAPENMDAGEVVYAIRQHGGNVSVTEDGRLRFTGKSEIPPDLVLRAAELGNEIREELGPPGPCSRCGGEVFYLCAGRWHCVGCCGLPEGEDVPETWTRAPAGP